MDSLDLEWIIFNLCKDISRPTSAELHCMLHKAFSKLPSRDEIPSTELPVALEISVHDLQCSQIRSANGH